MAVDPVRAKSLFLAASSLADPAERANFLQRECGGDAELRARVEVLLRADEAAPLPSAPEATLDSVPGQPKTAEYGDPTARVGAVLAGKYKLVEEIGEGGMGSVFMAQQTEPVKRAVAVKVIKAGMDSRAVLARFEAERQALAMMDHPNIARVLDAGTTDGGRPFFVMELVKGTPITRYCDEHKLTPRQRLELFVPVCQAIQHAHQKGIIHRDIKPSNVLVALYDDRPVPKVIDFGLAKAAGQRLTDKTLMTGFGAVVGTPEYMSPEQASLNNLDIDTRSDVYSLGVLLYELLTGTTPVDKKSLGQAALLEILRIVREVEAPRPSAKLSSSEALPSVATNRGTEPARLCSLMKGELDWLVLKALEKDRARRYDSANGLAQDIRRYLADEIVEARPPSVGYRLSKFIRRHTGQVLAASLVLLALVGGIVGTTLGLFEAWRQEKFARAETGKKEDALQAAAQRLRERDAANDQLLSVGARGLLRPLHEVGDPNDPEVDALWELAATTDERLRLRFVELALDDPVLARRLRRRAPFAFQALVGLDLARGTRIEELLGQRLQVREIAPEHQGQVALCLSQLGRLDRRPARTAEALLQAMSKTTAVDALESLARALAAVSARLEPKQAAQMCSQAAATLTEAMSNTTEWLALEYLARGLSEVSGHLEPKVAVQAAATLTQAMSNTTHRDTLELLAKALSAVSALLEPKEAAKVANTITRTMSKTTNALDSLALSLAAVSARLEPAEASQLCGQAAATLTQVMGGTTAAIFSRVKRYTNEGWDLEDLALGLAAVAGRLEAKDAAQAAATLSRAISNTTDGDALRFLAQGLTAVSARLEPKEAAQVAATLAQVMSNTTEPNVLLSLAKELSAVSVRLEPKVAAATLTQAMSKTIDPYALHSLAEGLSAVSARLNPKEAAQTCGQAAATLIQAMSKTTYGKDLQFLALGLAAVSARLEVKEAAQLCGQAAALLTQAMSKPKTLDADLRYLAEGVAAVSVRLEPKEAITILTQAMSTDWNALQDLGRDLSAVSARLEGKEAAEVAATLLRAMSKTTDPGVLRSLARGLVAVSARLEAKEAAATLTQALSNTTHLDTLESLAEGLSALSARLEPKEAAAVAATLTQTLGKITDPSALDFLAKALAAVSARLEPKEAAQKYGKAAAILIQAMRKTTDRHGLHSLALAAVSAHLEPKEAAQAAAALTQAMSQTTDSYDLAFLAQSLAALSARLEPEAAAQVAATLTQTMSKTTDTYALERLARGLSAVSARLDPKEAARLCGQAAATLTQAMSTSRRLAPALSAVAAHLDPKGAAEAAAALTQAMSKPTDLDTLHDLAQGLAAVSARLEPKEANQVCRQAAAALTQRMSRTTVPNLLLDLEKDLSAVSVRLESKEAAQVCSQAAAILFRAMSKTRRGASDEIGRLERRLFQSDLERALSELLDHDLPSQTLVDLLKHPLCVGETRRLVLDQLGRHYDRRFRDQWDFVDYVQQRNLGLDLKTPPVR